MTADEFKVWASKYGLSIEEAGAVLGTSRANAFKFANGSRPVSKSACDLVGISGVTKL